MTDKAMVMPLLKKLVTDLTEGRYDEIMQSGRNGRLTEQEIISAINEYPGMLSLPDDRSFFNFNQYDYNDDPDECAIEIDLWFDNKRSDLTLRAEVVKDDKGGYKIRIQDILVM